MIDYCLGKDIHFVVLTHATELLKMSAYIQTKQNLNGLQKIEDSVLLLTILMQFNMFVFLIPQRLMYPDPKAADARRPKKVEMPPKEYQHVQGGGMYMFTVKTKEAQRSMYLGLAVVFLFAILLFRVWPMWLRLGVWYCSYYLCIALVSKILSV